MKRLRQEESYTLRQVHRIFQRLIEPWRNDDGEFEDRVSVADGHVAVNEQIPGRSRWIYLPQLRAKEGQHYSSGEGYLRHIDRMISKHGADAVFEVDMNNNGLGDTPREKGENNDSELPKGVRLGQSFVGDPTTDNGTTVKHDGKGLAEVSPVGEGIPGGNTGTMSRPVGPGPVGPCYGGGVPGGNTGLLPRTTGMDYATQSQTGDWHPVKTETQMGNGKASKLTTTGKQIGVGTRLDDKGKDPPHPVVSGVASPKTPPYTEGRPRELVSGMAHPFGLSATDGIFGLSGGIHPHPLNSPSFTAFTKAPLHRLPPISSNICSPMFVSTAPTTAKLVQMDPGSFSDESRFGGSNPGGYVDEANARLGSKRLIAQAASIRDRMDLFFRSTEVGNGIEPTPRINPVKLIKELVGKSLRMAKTSREEKGSGLKLVLVDISPSCAEIRDACFAAGLAIAEADPNVVVIAHYNGYMTTGEDRSLQVGSRYREVPIITWDENEGCISAEDKRLFDEFLASGKLSGAIAFGDGDAAELYADIGMYAPIVWMCPMSERRAKAAIERYASEDRYFDKASMFIVPDVSDALSAVRGIEAATKARKL